MDLSQNQNLRIKACTWLIKLTLVMSVFAGSKFSATSNQQQHQRAQTEISVTKREHEKKNISFIQTSDQPDYYIDIQIVNIESAQLYYNKSIRIQILQYNKLREEQVTPSSLHLFHYARHSTEDFIS